MAKNDKDKNPAETPDEKADAMADGPAVDEEKERLLAKISQLEKENAELKAEIKKPVVNIKGFVLEADDPFAAGAMRVYVSSTDTKHTQRAILPFVLPYNDKPATKKAIESYIVRADGGGDKARTAAAREALAKL